MIAKIAVLCTTLCLAGAFLSCNGARMQVPAPTGTRSGFQQTNLVSDVGGNAQHTDPGLRNPGASPANPASPFSSLITFAEL